MERRRTHETSQDRGIPSSGVSRRHNSTKQKKDGLHRGGLHYLTFLTNAPHSPPLPCPHALVMYLPASSSLIQNLMHILIVKLCQIHLKSVWLLHLFKQSPEKSDIRLLKTPPFFPASIIKTSSHILT